MDETAPANRASMAFRCARRIERSCCTTVKYLPLVFVYGLTTWACWVVVSIGAETDSVRWLGSTSSAIGIILYLLLNWCYTTAVFTSPGSTTNDDGYGLLPTTGQNTRVATSFTVKSNGEIRFCKKCQARKPDRAHHCSTCQRCVLKMDHHCPWLATCVGLRNYKAFLLFLIYTTIFSLYCFAVSGSWFWAEVLQGSNYVDTLLPVNFIMLAVMSGIIGIVVGAFTSWHVILSCKNQTTVECLEKTRYLTRVKKTFHQAQGLANGIPQARQLVDFHASALPGITYPEEGEERRDGPRSHRTFEEMEREQSRKRYEEYLDEQDSEKLPHAFDLGWRQNLLHLMGPTPYLWFFPICNTTGDGWRWEPSPKWLAERERLNEERERQRQREINAGWGFGDDIPSSTADVTGNYHGRGPLHTSSSSSTHGMNGNGNGAARRIPSKADRILGRDPNLYADGSQEVAMRRLSPRGRTIRDELIDTDDDDNDHNDDGSGEEELEDGHKSTATSSAASNGATSAPSNRRTEAARRGMSVNNNNNNNNNQHHHHNHHGVTSSNRGWGRGGASGMLRKGSSQSVGSGSSSSRIASPKPQMNDDGVD